MRRNKNLHKSYDFRKKKFNWKKLPLSLKGVIVFFIIGLVIISFEAGKFAPDLWFNGYVEFIKTFFVY